MIASFVLVVNLMGIPADWQYIGHFSSCNDADMYMKIHFDKVFESKCILEEYIYLPEDLEKVVLTPSRNIP